MRPSSYLGRAMSLGPAKANLTDAVKQLRMRWDRIRSDWHDDAAQRLEREILDQLDPRVGQAIKGLDHVSEMMTTARHECADD